MSTENFVHIQNNPRIQDILDSLSRFTEADGSGSHSILLNWFLTFAGDYAAAVSTSENEDSNADTVNLNILETMFDEFGAEKLLEIILFLPEPRAGQDLLYRMYSLFAELCYVPETGAYSENSADNVTALPMEWLISIAQNEDRNNTYEDAL